MERERVLAGRDAILAVLRTELGDDLAMERANNIAEMFAISGPFKIDAFVALRLRDIDHHRADDLAFRCAAAWVQCQ